MSMGICMKALNSVYFKNKIDFLFEFVPQIILMLVLFGYMDVMIIAKWCTDWTGKEHTAPPVVSNMIDMALNGGAVPPQYAPLIGSAGFQQGLSIFFLLVALICTPTMLVIKPLHLDK
jgi:V-type H+-transporting ATPase subunit a